LKIFEIHGDVGSSKILVGESLSNLKDYIGSERVVIITDTNVSNHYKKIFPPYDVIEIGIGEDVKNLKAVEEIYSELIKLEADRKTFVVGIGGGLVCDVAGFAASTFMRGLSFGFVSTTLLSQVDASLGGKNGVNFSGYKNIVGLFNQPKFVICDTSMLKTLPSMELVSGFAEVVKYAAIGDYNLFEFLEKNRDKVMSLDQKVIERIVYDSVSAKAKIVERDEREGGERRKLNFGHTLGHAFEKVAGVSHGEAISAGMVVAAKLSAERGLMVDDDVKRLEALLVALKLPVSLDADKDQLKDAVRKDKKREGDEVNFVFLKKIGEAVVEKITFDDLEKVIDDLC